jgi:hypothetical protein
LGKSEPKAKFGFDLDNTLINYTESCKKYAAKIGKQHLNTTGELKKYLIEQDPTTAEWNRAQSWIYTTGLEFASLNSYLLETLSYLDSRGMEFEVHSHKTETTPESSGSIKLRDPMRAWLKRSELSNWIDIDKDVHFYETQNLKIQGIKDSGVSYFIDDLPAVFENPNYPQEIQSFLIGDSSYKKSFYVQITNFAQLQDWLEAHVR